MPLWVTLSRLSPHLISCYFSGLAGGETTSVFVDYLCNCINISLMNCLVLLGLVSKGWWVSWKFAEDVQGCIFALLWRADPIHHSYAGSPTSFLMRFSSFLTFERVFLLSKCMLESLLTSLCMNRCSFKSLPKGLVTWEAGKHSAAVKRLKEPKRCEVFNEIWIVISQILRCSGI
jgi:hypothetical protein